MTLSKYILVNISNLSFYLLNIVIICYSGVTIKENSAIIKDFDVSINCKKLYFYTISYLSLFGLYIVVITPRTIWNIFSSNPKLLWRIGDWILMFLFASLTTVTYSAIKKDSTYCNNIYNEKYVEIKHLAKYQMLSFIGLLIIYAITVIILFGIKRCEKIFINNTRGDLEITSPTVFV